MAAGLRRQNDRLDLLKGLAIYAVVLAHIPLPGAVGQLVCALAKFSVPVFFLISGYFSYNKGSKTIGRRAIHSGLQLAGVSAALLLFGCVMAIRGGQTVGEYLAGRMNPFFLKEILLYQVLPLPYAWPMWFLTALFIVYVLWWAMTWVAQRLGRLLPYGALAALALVLLLLHLWMSEWQALTGGTPAHSMLVRNAWLDAFPFFALGAWLGARQGRFLPWLKEGWLWPCLGASVALALAEHRAVGVIDVFVGTSLMAVVLVLIALVNPAVDRALLRNTLCFCGRNLTFSIFAFHVPLYGIIKEWSGSVTLFAKLLGHPWLLPFLICGLSTVAALGLYLLSPARWAKRKRRKEASQ